MTKQVTIAPQARNTASAAPECRAAPRLTAQWYTDADGALVMRWIITAEMDERRLADALAA